MKQKLLILSFSIFNFCAAFCQQQSAAEMRDNARSLMRQGDYDNASLLLIKAKEQSPNDIEIAKDLALNYYFQKDNEKALGVIKPVLDRTDADDQSFQIAGNIYKILDQFKEGEAMYKRGIKRFPKSGALYNEYGELLALQQNNTAINQWESGIDMDPTYPGNYYNAAKYYYFTTDKIWGVLYGEIFLNLEPLSGRTAEIKSLLLDSYRKLFSDADIFKNSNSKNKFEQAFLETMNKQGALGEIGISTESLIMIRTRFVLDWYENHAADLPFKLFEYQQQLLRQGIFEAYNQWIFGPALNLTSYQSWTSEHTTENTDFSNFQKGRIFKIPANQYYHK